MSVCLSVCLFLSYLNKLSQKSAIGDDQLGMTILSIVQSNWKFWFPKMVERAYYTEILLSHKRGGVQWRWEVKETDEAYDMI